MGVCFVIAALVGVTIWSCFRATCCRCCPCNRFNSKRMAATQRAPLMSKTPPVQYGAAAPIAKAVPIATPSSGDGNGNGGA